MVATKTERRVFLWTIEPLAIPKVSKKTVTLSEIIDILQNAWKDGTAIYGIDEESNSEDGNDDKNRVYIADIDNNSQKGILTILFNRGDPHAPDAALIASDGKVSVQRADEDQTQGWSAHLVISTNDRSTNGTYRACFEQMEHASTSLVQQLLTHIFKAHSISNSEYRFDQLTKDKSGKTKTEVKVCRPELVVQKQPSASLEADLKKGELSAIVLINSSEEYSGPGAANFVRTSRATLAIRPNTKDSSKVVEFAKRLAPWARKKGYNEIQFKIEKLPGNRSASPRFTLEEEGALETLYSQSVRMVDFSEILERCYDSICGPIRDKMIDILNDKKYW